MDNSQIKNQPKNAKSQEYYNQNYINYTFV